MSGGGGGNYDPTTGEFSTPAPTDASDTILAKMNAYFKEIAQGTCSETQQEELSTAFENFRSCTGGLDMKSLITYLPGALLGGGIKCMMGISAEGDLFNAETYLQSDGLPEDCNEAFLGSNPFGDMIRTAYLKPDMVNSCLSTLSEQVPTCRHYSWPMPVVGAWLKSGSCLVGSLGPLVDLICESELMAFKDCFGGKSDLCSAEEECKKTSMFINLMPPFKGAPLPDSCTRVAQEKNMGESVTLYNNYRTDCTTPWEGWTKPIGASTS